MQALSKCQLKVKHTLDRKGSYIVEKIPNVKDELAETGHERALSES